MNATASPIAAPRPFPDEQFFSSFALNGPRRDSDRPHTKPWRLGAQLDVVKRLAKAMEVGVLEEPPAVGSRRPPS